MKAYDQLLLSIQVPVRGGGSAVSAQIVMAAARGILLAIDKSKLEKFGRNMQLNPAEAHELCPEECDVPSRRKLVTQDEYGDLLEIVFGEIETKLLWVKNEASMDCGTDFEGEEAMLLTIDQLLRYVVHIAGDIA